MEGWVCLVYKVLHGFVMCLVSAYGECQRALRPTNLSFSYNSAIGLLLITDTRRNGLIAQEVHVLSSRLRQT